MTPQTSPQLIRLDCGIQCFERHDGYERFMGKFSCQCIYTSQSRSTDQTLTRWTSLSYVVPHLRRKWSCFNNEDWAEHLTFSVLWTSSSSIASPLSIRKLQSSLHFTANIINLGGDKSEETLIIMLTLCLLFQETQFEVSNIKLEGFSKC